MSKMSIPAGRAARFWAFAVLASAALLLSVAVPGAISMEMEKPFPEQQDVENGGLDERPLVAHDAGQDVLSGGAGQDVLSGGAGQDVLSGGSATTELTSEAPPVTENVGELPLPPATAAGGFRGLGWLNSFRRGKNPPEGMNPPRDLEEEVDGAQKRGWWSRFGRGKKSGQETGEESGQELESQTDTLDGTQKRGWWNSRFRRGKKSGQESGESGQELESQPKRRFWTGLNPKTWFRKKEPEPEPEAADLSMHCRLVRMKSDDVAENGLPTPQYIVRNIQRGLKEIKRWEKANLPPFWKRSARKWGRVGQMCKPQTIPEELLGLLESGIPGLSRNLALKNALGSLIEAVQYRITKSWFSCLKVKVQHKKAACHREEASYTELVAKLPLCSRDVWNMCQVIQSALDGNPLALDPLPQDPSQKSASQQDFLQGPPPPY